LRSAAGNVIKPLLDSFVYVSAGGDIQKALIGSGILHDGLGFPLDREHYGPLAFLELPHEIPRPAAECGERLNVLGDIQHRASYDHLSTFSGAAPGYRGGAEVVRMPVNPPGIA
jgi:hypothetical protein